MRVLVVALLVVAVVAGCSSESDRPSSPQAGATHQRHVTPGTCWSDEQLPQALGEKGFAAWVAKYAHGDARLGEAMRDDAAFSQRADCDQPHAVELYAMVPLSPKLQHRVHEYADLLDHTSPLFRLVRDEVNDRCAAGSPYGRAPRRAGLHVQLEPALSADSGLHLAWDPVPANLWAKGEHRFVCTFEQDRPGTLRYTDLSTSKLPVRARVCLDTPGRLVACHAPHQAEDIAEIMLNTAIEAGEINGRRAMRSEGKRKYVAFSDREYARLDKVCTNLLDMVSTKPHAVTARAYPGSVDEWPTRDGAYLATCYAKQPYDPPPRIRGTVFDKP